MSAFYNLPGTKVPPHVHDATQPAPEAATTEMPRPGALVAVVGDPVDGAVPFYVASLGYCVWRTATATDGEFLVEGSDILTEGGEPLIE